MRVPGLEMRLHLSEFLFVLQLFLPRCYVICNFWILHIESGIGIVICSHSRRNSKELLIAISVGDDVCACQQPRLYKFPILIRNDCGLLPAPLCGVITTDIPAAAAPCSSLMLPQMTPTPVAAPCAMAALRITPGASPAKTATASVNAPTRINPFFTVVPPNRFSTLASVVDSRQSLSQIDP